MAFLMKETAMSKQSEPLFGEVRSSPLFYRDEGDRLPSFLPPGS